MKCELKNLILLVTVITILVSCKGNRTPQNGYYFQDFENVPQWFSETPQLTNEIAKSGEFCTKMDASNTYSQCFVKKMADIKAKGYKKIKVKVWGALSNTSARCKLIVSINTDVKVYFWNGVQYNDYISKPNTWGLVTMETDLDKYPGEGELKVYSRIDGKEKAYMDDVEIQFSK